MNSLLDEALAIARTLTLSKDPLARAAAKKLCRILSKLKEKEEEIEALNIIE